MSDAEQAILKRWKEYVEAIDAEEGNGAFLKGMACGLQAALIDLWGSPDA